MDVAFRNANKEVLHENLDRIIREVMEDTGLCLSEVNLSLILKSFYVHVLGVFGRDCSDFRSRFAGVANCDIAYSFDWDNIRLALATAASDYLAILGHGINVSEAVLLAYIDDLFVSRMSDFVQFSQSMLAPEPESLLPEAA